MVYVRLLRVKPYGFCRCFWKLSILCSLCCRFCPLLTIWLIIELYLYFLSIWMKEFNWFRWCVLQNINDEERQTLQESTNTDWRLRNCFPCFDALFLGCTTLLNIILHLYSVFIDKLCIIVTVVCFMIWFEYETIGSQLDEALFVGCVTLLTVGCVLMYVVMFV